METKKSISGHRMRYNFTESVLLLKSFRCESQWNYAVRITMEFKIFCIAFDEVKWNSIHHLTSSFSAIYQRNDAHEQIQNKTRKTFTRDRFEKRAVFRYVTVQYKHHKERVSINTNCIRCYGKKHTESLNEHTHTQLTTTNSKTLCAAT